jgi:hypothetical protein
VPYSNTYDIAVPCASTVPLSWAVVLATAVAVPVIATGALVPPVVKHFNAPVPVPNPFVATSRKQYVVPGVKVPAGRLTANGPPADATLSTAVIVFRLDPTPYSNMNAVWPPADGSTVPLKVAPVDVIDVADPVVATGTRLAHEVVALRSRPVAVPRLFVATSRK